MKFRKPAKQDILAILSIIFFVILVTAILQKYEPLAVAQAINRQGTAGKMIYVSYLIIATVFPPLTSIILKPIALLAYGFKEALLLGFIGISIGALLNYSIAKRLGRPFMEKFLGRDIVREVDRFTRITDIKSFIILRILGITYHDYLSYAAGLGKINPFTYIIVTIPVCLFWEAFILYFSGKIFSLGIEYVLIFIGAIYLIAILFGLALWRRKKLQK